MSDILLFLAPPLCAGLILVGIHGYFGLHVLERGIIFVDLSLAQLAALGAVFAFLLGYPLHGPHAYLLSFSCTLIGALFFSWSRRFSGRLPQEAIIGVVYAVASAVAILLFSKAPEGASHIQEMLIGEILTVSWGTLLQMTILYAAIGLLHVAFQNNFILKQNKKPNNGSTQNGFLWDFLFYATFGAVVTSSVSVAGVLLVFSFLIIPASIARLLRSGFGSQLRLAWWIGLLANTLGIALAFFWDLPAGGSIIAVLGILYLFTLIRQSFRFSLV